MTDDLTFRLVQKTDHHQASLSGFKEIDGVNVFVEKTTMIFDLNNLEEVIQSLKEEFYKSI